MPNFNEIFQSTAEIKLLPVSESAPPPYRNFISGFHFDVRIVIGMSFCNNRSIGGRVMTSYPFFSTLRLAAILDLIWVILDHQRSAILDVSLVLKLGLSCL